MKKRNRNKPDPTTSRAYTTLILLFAKALKIGHLKEVELTDEELLLGRAGLCPIRIKQVKDATGAWIAKASLVEPLPPEEKKRIITLE